MLDLSTVIEKLIHRNNLSGDESFLVMKEILSGEIPHTQIAALLALLRAKGETTEELVGFVDAMRESMSKISCSFPVIADTCGTGGDGAGTFNISTAAALVVAGTGIPVAKHGNRSISSRCGSADILESAGVKIDMPREISERCLKEIGITFLFAPLYHPTMKNVAPVRKELGIRTLFNILGPLVNPAQANAQVIGVPRKELVSVVAKVVQKLSRGKPQAAVIVHEAGHDEVVLMGKCRVVEVENGRVKSLILSPDQFGLKETKTNSLKGGNARENATLLREILSGKSHPLQDVIVANAALAIVCADHLSVPQKKFKSDIAHKRDAARRAKQSIESGAALKKLDELIVGSNKSS